MLDTSIQLRGGLVTFLVGVSSTGLFLPRWSDAIADERETRMHKRPDNVGERIRHALAQVPDALLPVSAADIEGARGACKEHDLHVLAAAVCARRLNDESDVVLVTGNVGDFNRDQALERGIGVLDPDAFGELLLARSPLPVLRTVQRQPRDRYERYLQRMEHDGLVLTASTIRALFAEAAADE